MKDFKNRSPLTIFISYFKNHKKLFFVDILCATLIAAVDLAFPLVTRSALYNLLPDKLYATFFTVIAVMVLCYLLRSWLQYIVAYYGHTFGIRVEADIRSDLFAHMQKLGFDFYDQNRTGQLMNRLTGDLFDLTELAHHGPEDLLTSGLTIIGALIVMATIQWQLALVVGLLLPVAVLVIFSMRKRMRDASAALKEKTGHINTEIESSISGIRTSKAFANEKAEQARFEAANEKYRYSKADFHKQMGLFSGAMEFFLCSMNVIVIGVGGWLILGDQMDYRDLITFTLYVTAFINPIRRLANLSENLARGFAGLNRFVALMRTDPSVQDKENARELKDITGHISINNVSFAYKKDLEVLRDVTLEIMPGETLAIVGPSGGGKTTLCQLLPRFYDVDSGSICFDGVDIRDVTQQSLREHIGIVQQDVFLFADTIAENIRYGKPDATDEEIIEAAKKAEIYEDIMAMPEGFNTYVGERGTMLSGGQKQRVSIARIFLKDPPILILDEATSALDSVTEAKIQRAFDKLAQGRTTLIIAHRLSTIRSAQRIVSIADGKIVECGTHQQLIEQSGIYHSLYTTQHS